MGIIQKRADELKPSDMLARPGQAPLVVTSATASEIVGHIKIYVAHAGPSTLTSSFTVPNDHAYEVASPDLTPAQQHADQLLNLVREFVRREELSDAPMSTLACHAESVLHDIKPPEPPEPPTLAEALEALSKLTHAAREQGTVEACMHEPISNGAVLLDRARRAGLLP